jgi:hypothetical protein
VLAAKPRERAGRPQQLADGSRQFGAQLLMGIVQHMADVSGERQEPDQMVSKKPPALLGGIRSFLSCPACASQASKRSSTA